MAVPVSDRRDSNSGGRSGRLTVKPDMAVVMTTPCHPFTMASQSFIALEQLPWLPHERHSVPHGQARGTRTSERDCSRMPTHQTRILHLYCTFLPHIQTGSPCISHSVCCRNVTTAIFGLVGRPPEGAEARPGPGCEQVRLSAACHHRWQCSCCLCRCLLRFCGLCWWV